MPSTKSPTERTLIWLRDQGYVADVVERRITMRPRPLKPNVPPKRGKPIMTCPCGRPSGFEQVTRDFCGFADILAFGQPFGQKDGEPLPFQTLAVQTTSRAHVADRVAKVRASEKAKAWLACGHRILVVGWGPQGPEGRRKRWIPRVEEIFP